MFHKELDETPPSGHAAPCSMEQGFPYMFTSRLELVRCRHGLVSKLEVENVIGVPWNSLADRVASCSMRNRGDLRRSKCVVTEHEMRNMAIS